jgi:hypothetical protein
MSSSETHTHQFIDSDIKEVVVSDGDIRLTIATFDNRYIYMSTEDLTYLLRHLRINDEDY